MSLAFSKACVTFLSFVAYIACLSENMFTHPTGKNSSKKPFNKGFKSSRLKALKHFNEKTVCDNYSFW